MFTILQLWLENASGDSCLAFHENTFEDSNAQIYNFRTNTPNDLETSLPPPTPHPHPPPLSALFFFFFANPTTLSLWYRW